MEGQGEGEIEDGFRQLNLEAKVVSGALGWCYFSEGVQCQRQKSCMRGEVERSSIGSSHKICQ